MTITYSLDVANTRFCGFTKLLGRWKGSIYKILWKEFIVFSLGYSLLSIIYRLILDEEQKRYFERVVLFFEDFIDLIPLSFVLGFYVSLVIGRWWEQFDAIPWPDRICYLINAYVHGADDRSRMIRRTLGRYLILLQAITFQSVSTAVKKRFPTTGHLVAAGIMTKEERTIFEKLDAPYGKWWLPAQWFSSLAMRARKEGRIKDTVLLNGLLAEFVRYRSACGSMFNFDWISVPLVYTQVVTIATYSYALALMVGRQYLDPVRGYNKHQADLYVPIFTLLQFFFYVGWLKVAEQIVNPYGEDDDDFELNWCLDRNCHVVFVVVDQFHAKHPKLRKDKFWDELLPVLPQTKISAKNIDNPQLGSAFNLEVHPADAEFLPMDLVLEEDSDANMYPSDSVKQGAGVRYRPSFLANIFGSNFGQSIRRRSTKSESTKDPQGHTNPAYTATMERLAQPRGSTPADSRKSSLTKRTSPAHSRASSISFHPSSISRHRHKLYDVQQAENNNIPNGSLPDCEGSGIVSAMAAAMAPVVANFNENSNLEEKLERDQNIESDPNPLTLASIPEEPSRVVSALSLERVDESDANSTTQLDDVQNLVAEASKVLEELNRVVKSQGHRKDCELKGYESCCSLGSDDSSEDEYTPDQIQAAQDEYDSHSVTIDMPKITTQDEDGSPHSVL
ncbi:bestrophin-4 [Parasteatoda tepidariorum]|uniref:bestrophin-4 n=1 Tax=Parasteatoda tepidariorum TaxID=114398 RepID=UPI001C719439|nr:bestrophin-2 [Parasteatoda tepidariorum]XP_042904636.1 bestrophin-2 [Parasteatoda tepidariorum]XP_042904637.1 bestrophin-2 [Parasteatoda tepidariorum]XP_042904638.1 bestrophin-2 [Parasteatoda tepidariorum]